MVEQHERSRALQPWLLARDGSVLDGQDHDRRLVELGAGLSRHPGVRAAEPRVSAERLQRTLTALHEPDYVNAIARVAGEEPALMSQFAAPGMAPDTPVCESVAVAAFEGVRTAIAAADRVLAGERFAYAMCRPPGHHAGPSWLGGCCYFNNAAAAAHVLREGGLRPVAIIDLDIHYPNGTAAIVARSSDTTLCSLHSWPVVNVAAQTAHPPGERELLFEFREPPAADRYLEAVEQAIARLASSAQAIVLSLGYDTVAGDPHGSWSFEPAIFLAIGERLAASALPVCIVQEGGYALGTLAQCAFAFAEGLLGQEETR